MPHTPHDATHALAGFAPRSTVRTACHLLVNERGAVLASDPAIEALLRAAPEELRIVDNHLIAADPAWGDELATLLRAPMAGGTVIVTDSPERSLRVELRRLTAFAFADSTVLTLMTVQRQRAAAGKTSAVAQRFGLSTAEARLLDALCSGFRLRDYAARRPVSIHTARTQLKSLMAKIGVHSQIEAVRLALQHDFAERDAA